MVTPAPGEERRRVVILGAGRSTSGSLPSALIGIDGEHRVLDWLLDSFSVLGAPEVFFAAGYKVDEIVKRYPQMRFFYNPDWESTGPGRSLSLVPLGDGETFVSYADVLFRRELVTRMSETAGDLVLAVDSRWRVRYEARSRGEVTTAEKVHCRDGRVVEIGRRVPDGPHSAEFAGLLKLSSSATDSLRRHIERGGVSPRSSLPDVIQPLIDQGLTVTYIDVEGDWAELNAPQDVARFVLGTKAESLTRLRPLLRSGRISDLVSFTHQRWLDSSDSVLDEIRSTLRQDSLIVRSSAISEDSWTASNAGSFTSVADVPREPLRLRAAVDQVLRSYGNVQPENQVLVQPMLRDVELSGVIMTRTPTLGAPYFVINFDDSTARTDTVTSGSGQTLRTLYVHRGSGLTAEPGDNTRRRLRQLLVVVSELEGLVGHDSLDIEFAVTRDDAVHILQVRPIAVAHYQPVDDDRIAASISDAMDYVRELQKPSPTLVGSTTQFSVMSDWNPAEMIGTKPSRLAFSLYRHLITDETWAQQRTEYGYRDVRPCNLIVDILGHPFVDLRVDFNSFVPAALPDELAHRLVDEYLERVRRAPELHDKVEFDVLLTCTTFDFADRSATLAGAGFSPAEIESLQVSLLDITRAGIARLQADAGRLPVLAQRFAAIEGSTLAPLERAYYLLEDIRRVGIPVFAHLARHAFVAMSLLRSLEHVGCFSRQQVEAFLASLHTVASAMQDHAAAAAARTLPWKRFVAEYGHLRPGSYDITSPCYAAMPEKYLRPIVDGAHGRPSRAPVGAWDEETRDRIARQLEAAGLDGDVDAFRTFLKDSIEGRELAKFTFTRNLSGALEALAVFGASLGVDRAALSHVTLQDIMQLRGAPTTIAASRLRRAVQEGREASYLTQAACLPGQIFSSEDLVRFEQLKAEPNFVTQKVVRGDVVVLGGSDSNESDVTDKVVVIPNADPGYDWLFSKNIAGLITMYGGTNSHMAIRAAEFELPAAIGVGELLYETISRAELVEIDCASRRLSVIR
jgi:choline kinase/phosphohistidine swiveling domain-containing protein